jgi:predicted GNAT family acetyltransferase
MTAAAPEAVTVVRNDEKSRYEILVDGQVVGFSDYRMRGDRQVFVHTEIDPEFRGRDLAATLIRAALDDARADAYRVVPRCPYVAEFIQEHPEYADLVGA